MLSASFLSYAKKIFFIFFIQYFFFFSFSFKSYSQEKTNYPLEISNCGRKILIKSPPQRAITVGQNSTEILYSLGVFDQIKATSLWNSPVISKFEKENSRILKLNDKEPSFESILSLHPDFIANHLEWAIGAKGAIASYQQFEKFKIPVYTAPADCFYKDNKKAFDGLRIRPFSMEMIYLEIKQLGLIFNVNQNAKKLILDLQKIELDAKNILKQKFSKKPKVLFWYSSLQKNGPPYVAGSYGVPAYIAKQLGLQNIVSSASEWPQMSWEMIAKYDPDIIVIADMTRHRYPMDSAAEKQKFLKQNPLLKNLKAVKNNHILTIDAQSMNPTIRVPDAMKKISIYLQSFRF